MVIDRNEEIMTRNKREMKPSAVVC